MNINKILSDAYQGETANNATLTEEAKVAQIAENFWKEWAGIKANEDFLLELQKRQNVIVEGLFCKVLENSIDDVTMRVRLTEAATLSRVINAPLTNKGKY